MGGVCIGILEEFSFYRSFHMGDGVVIRSGMVDGLEEFEHVGMSGLGLGGFGPVSLRGIAIIKLIAGSILFILVVGEPFEVLQLLINILYRVTSPNLFEPFLPLTIPLFMKLVPTQILKLLL